MSFPKVRNNFLNQISREIDKFCTKIPGNFWEAAHLGPNLELLEQAKQD